MKRLLIISFVLAALCAPSFAQMGDARAKGLAGAMTAVGDDMNALFYNPAGLAFVRKSYFNVEANADAAINKSVFDPFSNSLVDYYSVYEASGPVNYYVYRTGEDAFKPFVFGIDDQPYLTQLEAMAQADGKDYASLNDAWKGAYYRQLRSMNNFYNALQSFSANPRVIVGGKHWAASAYAEYSLTPQYPAGSTFANGTLMYSVDRRIGAIVGVGFDLGPLALGANAKYSQDATYSKALDLSGSTLDMQNIQEILSHTIDTAAGEYQGDPKIEVGLGALLTLGMVNLAVYNDNVMPFLDKGITAPFFESFLNTMNFGLSWMPSDNKFKTSRFPLAIMATADFKNFGNIYTRKLCAGFEFGLNAADLFEALVRFGYTQNLPGSYAEMASAFKPENGVVSVGATAKIWILKFDAAANIPVSAISGLYNWDLTDVDRAMEFMNFNITAAIDL